MLVAAVEVRLDEHERKVIAAAAAVLLVVVGCQSMSGNALSGGQAAIASSPGPTLLAAVSPTSSPSSAASASPSAASPASAAFPLWYAGESRGTGILPAGSQTTKSFVPRFTFTVPEGWVNGGDEHGFYGLFPDTPANQAEFAASGGLAQEIHMGPLESPYFLCDAWEDNRGATTAEMVANEALAMSEPIDVAIGGPTGKQGRRPARSRLDGQLSWRLADVGPRGHADSRDPDRGVIVNFVNSLHSAGHEAFLAEAMPIIESFQFDPNP